VVTARFDMSIQEHSVPQGASPISRRTCWGGLASIFAVIIAAALATTLCISFFNDNGPHQGVERCAGAVFCFAHTRLCSYSDCVALRRWRWDGALLCYGDTG